MRNEMLTHYNRIVIGCLKDFFQSVNTNNLALQTLKELNLMLTDRAPELAAHYNMALELHQISTEEVPNLVKFHLYHNTTYNNQYHQYNRQSSPLPRYSQQSQRSDTF